MPMQGDIVYIDFDPQAGREQKGHRPALVVSNTLFNQATHFAVVCPITSVEKGYAFEVKVPDRVKVSGVVLTDQVKSLDVLARKLHRVDRVSIDSEFFQQVLMNVRAIFSIEEN